MLDIYLMNQICSQVAMVAHTSNPNTQIQGWLIPGQVLLLDCRQQEAGGGLPSWTSEGANPAVPQSF